MGAWDDGPFDNDTAAEWRGELDNAAPSQRPETNRTAMTTAADNQESLDCDDASPALASMLRLRRGAAVGMPGPARPVSRAGWRTPGRCRLPPRPGGRR
jgi:hypothetical protein